MLISMMITYLYAELTLDDAALLLFRPEATVVGWWLRPEKQTPLPTALSDGYRHLLHTSNVSRKRASLQWCTANNQMG